jgi:DNA-binding NarL/FixJ family response regulator
MRVLIVDDHQLIRAALRDLLLSHFTELDCVQAGTADEVLTELGRQPCDLAIIDLFIPGETPFVLIRKLSERWPVLPLVVVSASDNPAHISECIKLGVLAYVNKGAAMEQIVAAVNAVLTGKSYFPQAGSALSRQGLAHEEILPTVDLEKVISSLTDRQLDIVRLVAEGKSNKQIARERNLSDNTVKVHVSAILKILGLSNRTQIGLLAQKLGLISSS